MDGIQPNRNGNRRMKTLACRLFQWLRNPDHIEEEESEEFQRLVESSSEADETKHEKAD